MPIKDVVRTPKASQYYKNVSYETLAAGWLSGGGWEVLMPLVDHGKKTDLVVADDSNYYRIQIKTIDTNDENIMVENMWGKSMWTMSFIFHGIGIGVTSHRRSIQSGSA